MALALIENPRNINQKQAYFTEVSSKNGSRLRTGSIFTSGIDGEFVASAVSQIANKYDIELNTISSLNNVKFSLLRELSRISVHLEPELISSLSQQLDNILSEDEWDKFEPYPNENSWRTLLRVLTYMSPNLSPRLTFHNGKIILNWYSEDIEFSVECLKYNRISWVASVEHEEGTDIAAGEALVPRIRAVANAYNAKNWLF